jgi:F1F0 ATPase subunit 2
MTLPSYDAPTAWAAIISLTIHLGAGIALGILYFRSLWWNVHRFAHGGRLLTIIALIIGRFVLLGALMTLASLEGALPLLMLALGVLIARSGVIRSVREAAP